MTSGVSPWQAQSKYLMATGAGKTTYIVSARFRFFTAFFIANLSCLSPSPNLSVPPPLAYFGSPLTLYVNAVVSVGVAFWKVLLYVILMKFPLNI
jgi:hypothetical protein